MFQIWNRIFVKNVIQSNHRMCARYYSALLKCHHRTDCVLLSQTVKQPHFSIQPCDKRDFIGWVRDKKDGYRTQKDESETAHLKFGIKQFKKELKIWKEEVKEQFRNDPTLFVPPGMCLLTCDLGTKLKEQLFIKYLFAISSSSLLFLNTRRNRYRF